jgi:pyruvate/2-oxoglutarate dehydrogenase complex dihydrolipoamide dehydrogenase (E3) component
VNSDEVLAREARLIGEVADYRREELEAGKFDSIRGPAFFLNWNEEVHIELLGGGSETVEADRFLIATEPELRVTGGPGLPDMDFFTRNEALELAP